MHRPPQLAFARLCALPCLPFPAEVLTCQLHLSHIPCESTCPLLALLIVLLIRAAVQFWLLKVLVLLLILVML